MKVRTGAGEREVTWEEFKAQVQAGSINPDTPVLDRLLTEGEWRSADNLRTFHRLSPHRAPKGEHLRAEEEAKVAQAQLRQKEGEREPLIMQLLEQGCPEEALSEYATAERQTQLKIVQRVAWNARFQNMGPLLAFLAPRLQEPGDWETPVLTRQYALNGCARAGMLGADLSPVLEQVVALIGDGARAWDRTVSQDTEPALAFAVRDAKSSQAAVELLSGIAAKGKGAARERSALALGWGYALAERWADLEALLAARAGVVRSAAISGLGSARCYGELHLRRRAEEYEADPKKSPCHLHLWHPRVDFTPIRALMRRVEDQDKHKKTRAAAGQFNTLWREDGCHYCGGAFEPGCEVVRCQVCPVITCSTCWNKLGECYSCGGEGSPGAFTPT